MKTSYRIITLITLILTQTSLYSQNLDPLWDIWQYEHGATIEKFINDYGEVNYYVTWSSSAGTPWRHDIFNKVVAFDTDGKIYTVIPDNRYISVYEAQEPISTAINPDNNYIFSIWEDGSDSDIPEEAVNVHAQLHLPDGTIIKNNFLLAGGKDAQHSAVVTHLRHDFFAIYCDDDVPGGTAIFANSFDDQTGDETGFFSITPIEEYHWWPTVAASDDGSTALIAWIHDEDIVAGCIVRDDGMDITVLPYHNYLTDIQFVNQQVNWLENISKFAVIAKTLDQDKSKVCLIDTNGSKILETEVPGAVLQEARPAIKWDGATHSYIYLYPTGVNDINVLKIGENEIIFHGKIIGDDDPELSWLEWKKTGTWSTFVQDETGNDEWNGRYIALFAWGDYDTDEELMATVYIDTDIFSQYISNEELITYDDFESGWGNFRDGGGDCSLYTGSNYSHQGNKAVRIRDNSGAASSFYHKSGHNVTSYDQIKVEFWFKAYSMENNEDFFVEYFDGTSWNIVADFIKGEDFVNNRFYYETVTIDRNEYDFSGNMKIRFRCDASSNYDNIYIDEVKVSGIRGNAGMNSAAMAARQSSTQVLSGIDLASKKINIFPNPVSKGKFNLHLSGFENVVNIRMYNLQGNLVYNKNFDVGAETNIVEINGLQLLPGGMYLLKVSEGYKTFHSRVLLK